MNSSCGCGSGKKFKKCCFLKNAPADVPHLHFSQIVLDNIWKRFPESNTTEEYWLTKGELDAFNELLDLWLGLPASLLEEHGVNESVYNAISDIKQQQSIERLLSATKERIGVTPTQPNHFRSLGELARIFHSLRLALFVKGTYATTEDVPNNNVPRDIEDCIDEFRNMLLVGVHNKTLDELMVTFKSKEPLPVDNSILQIGNPKVGMLIDISRKRIYEVSCADPNTDVLFWTKSKKGHYSHVYLSALADHIEKEGRPILATEWVCQQKLEQMKLGKDTKSVVPRIPKTVANTGEVGDVAHEYHLQKNWVYISGRSGNLSYHPVPGFLWKTTKEKGMIIGYLRYVNSLFGNDNNKIMSPVEWMCSKYGK